MGRSGMDLNQFNSFMKKCSRAYGVRYVTPTIHPKFKIVVSVVLHTNNDSVEFNCTNNPDENYNLFNVLDNYLNEMGGEFDSLG